MARLLVSLLWAVGGIIAFASGAPVAGLIAVAYLFYLWGLKGRWLVW